MTKGFGPGVIRNFLSIIAGNFLNKLVSIAVLVMLARYLDPARFGMYSFVTAYVLFFGIFTDMGLNLLVTRKISDGGLPAETGFGHAIILRLLLTLVSLLMALSFLHILGYRGDIAGLVYVGSLALFLSFRGIFFRTVFEIPFMVRRKMHHPALINFLSELFTLGVILLSIRLKVDLWTLILNINLANLPGFAMMAYMAVRHLRPVFRIDAKVWKELLKKAVPLGTAVFLEGVFVVVPFFMLSFFSQSYELGLYSLPYRLVSSLWIIPYALMISLLPDMSRHAATSGELFAEDLLRGLAMILLLGIPIVLFTGSFSEEIINALTGRGYEGSAPVLVFMVWGTLMYFINSVFFYAFTASGRQKLNTFVWAVVALLCILLSWVLVPAYSHFGAALSFDLSLAAGAVLNVYLLYRTTAIKVLPLASRFSLCLILPLAIISSGVFSRLASTVSGLAAFLVFAAVLRLLPFRRPSSTLSGSVSPLTRMKPWD